MGNNNKDNKDNTEAKQNMETEDKLKELGIPGFLGTANNIQFISIIGEVEGHNLSSANKKTTKYEHIIPLLINSQQDPKIEGVFIILNTVGGDVEAGLALSEMIKGLSKPTISLVLGGGHSIGIPLATSTNYTIIVPTATMTVHPIRTTGLVIGAAQTFRYFEKMQQRISQFILGTSRIDEEKLRELMYATDQLANDIGTILVGEEAVNIGLIDEVGDFSYALNKLQSMIANNK